MKFTDAKINKIGDMLDLLGSQCTGQQPVWYRGHSDKRWKLVPSVARTPNSLGAEFTLIKRFKQNALPFIQRRPEHEWEWMYLLQHYGVPTRLLDWSESPLVALFFACEEVAMHGEDGAVWCLLPRELNKIANVSHNHEKELPFLGEELITESYLPSKVAQERTSYLKPVAATGVRDSPRMYAQLGTFTIIHRVAHPIEELDNKKHIWRWIVPKGKKKLLLAELNKLSINRLSLFPELSSVAQLAKEDMV